MMKEHFTKEIINKPIRKVKKKSNCASEKKQKKKQFGCRTSLCFTDQETQKEILLGGTNPF